MSMIGVINGHRLISYSVLCSWTKVLPIQINSSFFFLENFIKINKLYVRHIKSEDNLLKYVSILFHQ